MRLILAEDSALLREGLARALAARGIKVTGEAAEAATLFRLVDRDPPDAVLLDLRMPPTFTDEGLQAAERIRASHPGVAVLLLSQYTDIALAARLVETLPRAAGYLLKERIGDTDQLTDALHRVTRGELVLDPDLVRALVARKRTSDPLRRLTERERAVLALMAEGRSNAGIAGRLYLSPKSIERHVAAVFDKLGLPPDSDDNRRVLAVIAFLRTPA
jgi:DNA-binding NarL/FixJ family response regulator